MRKSFYRGIPLVLVLSFLGSSIFAQSSLPPRIDGPMIDRLVSTITSKILPMAGLLAFGFIVYGGYMWMMSAGDPDKVKRAQGTLTWAIIGLIFTILVGLILKAILDAVV
jgi:hypothetical protein